jgi:branched-chain amino acid transport system substrate-binding protein
MEITFRRKMLFASMGIIVLIAVLIFAVREYKQKKGPIKIGMVTTLTGGAATAGINSRDGVMLAVEKINRLGGINGRPVELIVKDDKRNFKEALRADQELIDEGVVAIMGHGFSSITLKVVPLMNEKNVLLISHGSNTAKLTGLDDYLIRVSVPITTLGPVTADLAYGRLNLRKMAVVYDSSNPGYTESYYRYFRKQFEKLGSEVSRAVAFDSRNSLSFPNIADEIMASDPQGVFITSNSIHGALVSQHLKKINSQIKIIACRWALGSPDFIRNGGRAVEGVFGISEFNRESSNESFQTFKNEYESRFGQKFNSPPQLAHEGALLLFSALSKTDDPKKLKAAILEQRTFKGLDGDIIIDGYGDPLRPLYIQKIQNGEIQIIGKIDPSRLKK